ncbi:MAG: hypothetical protein DBY04_01325 [Clostridiales bacterium]|nr:MAG: hypothetical protein DBY04_01325 [Clostridiales bacterium]
MKRSRKHEKKICQNGGFLTSQNGISFRSSKNKILTSICGYPGTGNYAKESSHHGVKCGPCRES